MKKSLLALAVAAFAATAANATAVYEKDGTALNIGGQVEFMAGNANNYFGNDNKDSTTRDRARLNMEGRTQLTSGIAAYGMMEWEANHEASSSESTELKARYSYLGVDFGAFGKIQAGRYEDPFEYASNVVDNLEEVGVYGGMDERNSGNLSYMWSGFGFDAGVNYQFAVDNYHADDYFEKINVDSGFSVYAGYTSPVVGFGPIAIRAAYQYLNAQSKHDGATDADIDNIKTYDIGLSWGTFGSGLYFATNYNHSKGLYLGEKEVEVRAWESMASYGLDMGVVVSVAYSDIKKTTIESERKEESKKYAQLIASYDVNENFRFWGEAIFDCNSDKDMGVVSDSKDEGTNAFLVGARYTF